VTPEQTEWLMWAVKIEGEGGFRNIFPSTVQVNMCLGRGESPTRVKVTLDENGPFFGWMSPKHVHPSMIYIRMLLLEICFPYGIDSAVAAGQGRVVRLRVESSDEA
jgi:hypothetical protein